MRVVNDDRMFFHFGIGRWTIPLRFPLIQIPILTKQTSNTFEKCNSNRNR